MKVPTINEVQTEEQAREIAIHFQASFEQNSYSYGELSEWQAYFEQLARKYGLIKEFKENGII